MKGGWGFGGGGFEGKRKEKKLEREAMDWMAMVELDNGGI